MLPSLYLAHAAPAGVGSSLVALHLETEMRVDPVGVDAPHPRLSWQLAAADSTRRGLRQTAYRILVATSLVGLEADAGDVWDSGVVPSSRQTGITFNGASLSPLTRYQWKVQVWDQEGRSSAWSKPAEWYSGMLDEEWKASWIAAHPDSTPLPPTREGVDLPQTAPEALPIFRRGFLLEKPVASALVCVSGLGQYELRVNGSDVTASVMNPGWTDYRKRIFYNMYDATALLKPGMNTLGVMLGNGMYHVPNAAGRYSKFTGSFGQPKLLLAMTIRYTDGSVLRVTTDRKWSTSSGPITFSSIYGGEDYDARKSQPGWETSPAAGTGWTPAIEVAAPGKPAHLVAQLLQPVVIARTLHPVHVSHFGSNTSIYDLGENFSGWPNLVVRGPAGSQVKLLPGELLDRTGHVTQASNNAGPGRENSFTYTLDGRGEESWHPQFSYNGFRYVEVEALPAKPGTALPAIVSLTGSFLHDGVPLSGSFASSDKLLIRIHNLIDQAILSNMFSVLTDCPTREKLGWLEQTHLAATSIMYNYDVRQLYESMADNMADDQLPSGLVPSIAPEMIAFVTKEGKSTAFRDSPEWGSAIILSPLAAYRFYGDTLILAEHYGSMQRYVTYLGSRADNHILSYGLGDWYDIGPAAPGVSQLTGKGLTATAIYYQDLVGMAEIAEALGKQQDAQRYSDEAGQVKQAFNRQFFQADKNQYDSGSQTANAMPLVLGLVPQDQRAAVLAHLVADIHEHTDHVTAGDIGFHYVVRALTEGGRSDVLLSMLSRMDSPSYGYQLSRGATSLTEAWDSNPTSSQNHFMLGHAEEWFYRGLAGIEIDMARPEADQFNLHPTPLAGLTHAEASVETIYGQLRSSWTRQPDGIVYDLTIPAGHSAGFSIPVGTSASFTESGNALKTATGLSGIRQVDGLFQCTLASGTYHFFARDPSSGKSSH